jgi:hypothetical protein
MKSQVSVDRLEQLAVKHNYNTKKGLRFLRFHMIGRDTSLRSTSTFRALT